MYPEFVRLAEAEGKSDAVLAFTHAMKAEQVHATLYKKALDAIKSGKDMGRKKTPISGLRKYADRQSPRQVSDLRCFRETVPGNHSIIFSSSVAFSLSFSFTRSFFPVQPHHDKDDCNQCSRMQSKSQLWDNSVLSAGLVEGEGVRYSQTGSQPWRETFPYRRNI